MTQPGTIARFRMKMSRVPTVGVAAMNAGEARTQEALVAAGCPLGGVRPRTKHRTVQCGLGGRGFILNRAQTPPATRRMARGL